MMRPEQISETGKLVKIPHCGINVFRYGDCTVKKYRGGQRGCYCVATVGNAITFDAESEQELVDRINRAGYGERKAP